MADPISIKNSDRGLKVRNCISVVKSIWNNISGCFVLILTKNLISRIKDLLK